MLVMALDDRIRQAARDRSEGGFSTLVLPAIAKPVDGVPSITSKRPELRWG
jgi:hypothetical protein